MEKLAVSGSLSILDSNIIMMSGQHAYHLIPLHMYLLPSSTNNGLGPPTLTPPLSHITLLQSPSTQIILFIIVIYALLLASPLTESSYQLLNHSLFTSDLTADVKSLKIIVVVVSNL
jgi:hypothetical protein